MTPEPNRPSTADEISELLLRWRELRDQGQSWSVEQLCPDRPEVQEQLRQRISAIESMEGQLLPRLRTTMGTPDGPVRPEPPRSLAGYEILEELGRGGMGVVYKAKQKSLNRLVALKMILAGVHAGVQQRQRFRAEAEALGRLRHPNIVQVYETGEADGLPFLSLEYVESGSLDRVIAGKGLAPPEAATLIETLARAVGAAHSAGIVHRDLKPANVLLAASGLAEDAKPAAALIPKITDFGLAKLLDGEGGTRSGDVIGTPCYMAPEQAEGRIKEIGPAADIYALGAILYECLTGAPPFQGQSAIDVLHQVAMREPVPPSRLRARLPRDLETICLKCLEKAPARRYATAEQLADDLRRFVEHRPITARPVGVLERGLKWIRRRPERAGLALFLLAASALVAFLWLKSQPESEVVTTPAEARAILVKYCFHCHGLDPERLEGDLNVLDRAQLLDPKREFVIVVPGDANGSRLIERIEDGSMPPDTEEEEGHPRLSSTDIARLKSWVQAGAAEFQPPSARDRELLPPSPLAVQVHTLFVDNCLECHKVGKAQSGVRILNHDQLVEKKNLVVPRDPEASRLYRLLIATDRKKRMPPKERDPLTPEEIDLVKRWIEKGAPAFPLPRPKQPLK